MGLPITPPELDRLAAEFDLDVKAIKSVLHVESSGYGFSAHTGKIIIRFEPHHFLQSAKVTIPDLHAVQQDEWTAFDSAFKIDPVKAMINTSWGIGQIMGWNAAACGYKSPGQMVDNFKISEFYQISGMLMFIKSNPGMFRALKELNWPAFAARYNGPAYKENDYDNKLKRAYDAQT